MNHITVPAHGAPNSLVRRVQHDPFIAYELLTELRELIAVCEDAVKILDATGLTRVQRLLTEQCRRAQTVIDKAQRDA